ncbi:SDR family NAD(P)-dependent oxidoreductase [Cupriavidus malaysiensis]|uniref:3-oxoacyl-ACP reductase n=1 Tax=Cupriavidus malaysiensis TaxID=367825 RepID=A0ABN4TMV6_9BURK|nr:SDR family NAD(P)-dependent oxidoreductase [Cupriavidus malaysiensis]AOZ08697.1 3-oxoacyl-ACP reductase [Cupriavidus malaysiensis]
MSAPAERVLAPVPVPRVAVVTGAARGIGLAIAGRLAAEGHAVALWDLDPAAVEAAAAVLRAQHRAVAAVAVDISSAAQVRAALDDTVAALGRPALLVNNAAILGPNGPTVQVAPAAWQRVFDINVLGALHCVQAVVPMMVADGWGRVVNVASIAGKEGNPFAGAYAASKAALISLTKSLGKELAASGVLLNCITPSAADTEIFGTHDAAQRELLRQRLLERVPMQRFVRVEEVAEMAAWLCSPSCSFSTGAVFDISGGRAVY